MLPYDAKQRAKAFLRRVMLGLQDLAPNFPFFLPVTPIRPIAESKVRLMPQDLLDPQPARH